MSIKIILITGACCSGKSHFAKYLKEKLENEKTRIHDFDELIKLSLGDAIDLFLNRAIQYSEKDTSIVICGGITPQEIKNSKLYDSAIFEIHCLLLHVSHDERKKRLQKRDEFFFQSMNKENIPKEEFIDLLCLCSEEYKSIVKDYSDTYSIVDNTNNFDNATYELVCSWVKSKIGLGYEIK